MLVKNVTLNGTSLMFSIEDSTNKDNHFTILIGKNASGKSEVLKEICHLLIRSQIKDGLNSVYVDILDHYLDRNYKDTLHRGEKNISSELELIYNHRTFKYKYIRTDEKREFINYLGEKEYIKEQVFRHCFGVTDEKTNKVINLEGNNIIAVSSGQFDKFPVLQSMGLSSDTGINYTYIGVQNDRLSSRYDSVLSLKIGEIGHAIIKFSVESKKINLNTLLKMLGFSGKVKIKYEINNHALSNDFKEQEKLLINGARYSSVGLGRNNGKLKDEDIVPLKKALSYFNELHSSDQDKFGMIEIDLLGAKNSVEATHLYYASKVNSLEIKDLYFQGEHGLSSLLLASSGQINLLNIFFGISSCITDNSLILIDEPEISLHTDWQIKFIPLIREVFSKYKGCHYIIATHAPMIISNVGSTHSSILNMTTGDTISSKDFNNQSSDYINLYLFGTPGPKNETINREVVSLLSAISKRKKLTESDFKKARFLIKWSYELIDGDPTKDLVNILEEALEVYSDD
ncbi:AAA family ATPase [Yersinia kristensenii]|uniref:AAA family ATPase n=1 Tax=Yersinia kristensenii TaxID=28152 RepID=UPI0005E8C558|nr:AAA family ATPase [Yersinia kristensenii]CNG42111.1 Predicted ATP-binding protein involved in virulence [Yersinia kristensenii]CNJ92016.1 Predicted ATP-binding protein involved in virulence [Yersinia kristensenii]